MFVVCDPPRESIQAGVEISAWCGRLVLTYTRITAVLRLGLANSMLSARRGDQVAVEQARAQLAQAQADPVSFSSRAPRCRT